MYTGQAGTLSHEEGPPLRLSWTNLPFKARNRAEFSQGLTNWLGQVFYEQLPGHGYEVREEQIYTAFRMAGALAEGQPLFAEAGSGTGKTFAYLLPAVCYARFQGRPVVVATSSKVLQAQLIGPQGDIQALSRLLGPGIDARLATEPGEYVCRRKADALFLHRPKGWKALHSWARKTKTGARSEVPRTPDELWDQVSWDPSLPCDACRMRATCHVSAARQRCRAATDLIVTDHRLFAADLLTRAERLATGHLPLLPAYSAVVLDEAHHWPETWQRAQGHVVSRRRLAQTLDLIAGYARKRARGSSLQRRYERLADVVVAQVREAGRRLLDSVAAAVGPEEGKRTIPRAGSVMEAVDGLVTAVEQLQDELATEETMNEGLESEVTIRAFQARLDDLLAALSMLREPDSLPWLEGEDMWVVPRRPLPLYGEQTLSTGTPVLFSSATLEPAYMARVLQINRYGTSRVGVPFNLAEQVLVYRPAEEADDVAETVKIIEAMRGRALVLLNSRADLERYRRSLTSAGLPWRILFEGDGERGAMLTQFRKDASSVLVGVTFWEGVDVPGESLSCVVIPRLPFPAHDPLIRERREQAQARGEDPFLAVDLPEMLIRLKQGAGRLIRTAQDRGVLALLDLSYLRHPWRDLVADALPEGAEVTADLQRIAAFCRDGRR